MAPKSYIEDVWLDDTIRRAKSWQYYVPLSGFDVQYLASAKSFGFALPEFSDKQKPFFFGNHPIKWVNVSGRVTSVQDKLAKVLLEIDDGSGESVSVMATGALAFSISGRQSSIRVDSYVVVNGILIENQWGRTVNVQRLSCYEYPMLATHLICAYEAMVVRRHFLELECDYTGPVATAMYPDNSKTLYTIINDPYTEAGRLHKGPPDFVIP